MKLTNQSIYEYANNLSIFNNCNIKMPVKISFFLQRNIKLITEAAQEIEQARMQLAATFGQLNATQNGYDIPEENLAIVNKELADLFSLEQEINIHIFKLEDFDNMELDYQQMSAILFMIEE